MRAPTFARAIVGLVGLLTFARPAVCAAQGAPVDRVLVMPFAAEVDAQAPGGAGGALWLGEAASMLIGEGLNATGVSALSRDERVAAFAKLQLPMSSALTRATMIRVGELIGASEVVFGEVRLGVRLEVRARMIRLAAGQEVALAADEAPLSDIFPLLGRVAGRVAGATGRARVGASAAMAPMPLEAFENYVKGLVAATPSTRQRFLESAARQATGDARVVMALARAYRAQGLAEKALAQANAIAATSPLWRQARFTVSLALIDLKRYDGAFQELTALDASKREAAISNALGVVQLRQGAPPGVTPAVTYFTRAVQQSPNDTNYLFDLGYAHALAQNATDALTWLREAVRFDAARGDAHLVMSAVLAGSGRTAEAQREFDLARQLGAGAESAVITFGTKIPAGLEYLDAGLGVAPMSRLDAAIATPVQRDQQETASFHLSRAREMIAAHRDRDATGELKRAVYLAPYEDAPHVLLGGIYQRSGQLAAAVDEFKVALWCRETPATHVALGSALFDSGDKDGARREAERALVLTPTSTEARDLLKRIGG